MAALDSVVVFCLAAACVWLKKGIKKRKQRWISYHDMRVGVKLHSRAQKLLAVLLLVDSTELLGNGRLRVVVNFLEAKVQVL